MMLGLSDVLLEKPTPTTPVLEIASNCFVPSQFSRMASSDFGALGVGVCAITWGVTALVAWAFLSSGGRR